MSEYEKYRLVNETKFNNLKFIGHSYYAHPDGQDLFGKLVYTTKMAAAGGWIYGLCKILGPNPVDQYKKMLTICLRSTIPAVGVAASFTVATYYATNFRKKDDELNYAIGGITAGTFYGSFTRSTLNGLISIVLFVTMGVVQKSMQMNGRKLVVNQSASKYFSPYTYNRFSWSLWPEKEGNWEALPPEEEI